MLGASTNDEVMTTPDAAAVRGVITERGGRRAQLRLWPPPDPTTVTDGAEVARR